MIGGANNGIREALELGRCWHILSNDTIPEGPQTNESAHRKIHYYAASRNILLVVEGEDLDIAPNAIRS